MWIPNIADTKRTFRKAGRVADFCAICGTLRPFSVDRADAVVRVLYVPLGSTRKVWWLGRCESCGLLSVLDQHRYARVSSRRTASMEDLLQETFPDALERCRDLLNDFELARESPVALSATSRRRVIERVILSSLGILQATKRRRSSGAPETRQGCLVAFLFALGAVSVPMFFERAGWAELVMWVLLGLMLVIGIGALACRIFQVPLVVERRIYPLLGRALVDLRPNTSELAHILHDLQHRRAPFVHRLSAAAIVEAIGAERVRRKEGRAIYSDSRFFRNSQV